MAEKDDLAKKGEELAVNHLKSLGQTILSRNYRFKKAEVDIISLDNNLIVFTEVKTRTSAYLSDASLLVPISKQKQIIKAADNYLKDFYPNSEARFDIMIVVTNSEYTKMEYIVDAFYPMA